MEMSIEREDTFALSLGATAKNDVTAEEFFEGSECLLFYCLHSHISKKVLNSSKQVIVIVSCRQITYSYIDSLLVLY